MAGQMLNNSQSDHTENSEEINFSVFADLCRFCSLRVGTKIHLFEKEAEHRQILFKVRSFLPIALSKDDCLPKKICDRCVLRLEQFYEWRTICIQSDSVLRHYADSMRAVTATISCQDGAFNLDKMTTEQKSAYLEAHMEVQQHMQQVSMQLNKQMVSQLNPNNLNQHINPVLGAPNLHVPNQYSNANAIKVPQINSTLSSGVENTFTVPDDGGMGYESGVRVLQSLGNWTPDIPPNVPRPNLIPFIEPYVEGGSMHPASRLKALQQVQQASQGIRKTTQSKSNKAFECTVCGKGLARKDKLKIHERIHTGEKPYICEVCDKAFARRDKLVIHMNKFKHLTPTNLAPLGKRHNNINTDDNKKKDENNENKQNQMHSHIHHESGGSDVLHNQLHSQQQQQPNPPNISSMSNINIPPSNQQPLSWTCELCGRMFGTRDEWSMHAKSHLEQNGGSVSATSHAIETTEKANRKSNSSIIIIKNETLAYSHNQNDTNQVENVMHATQTHIPTPLFNPSNYCFICKKNFSTNSEFMLHIRSHVMSEKLASLPLNDLIIRSTASTVNDELWT